jgi:hypothetical protein
MKIAFGYTGCFLSTCTCGYFGETFFSFLGVCSDCSLHLLRSSLN